MRKNMIEVIKKFKSLQIINFTIFQLIANFNAKVHFFINKIGKI